MATSEGDGQICRELVTVDKSEFERRKSRRMSRSGSRASLGDSVDLEQKGNKRVLSDVHVTETTDMHVPQGELPCASSAAN